MRGVAISGWVKGVAISVSVRGVAVSVSIGVLVWDMGVLWAGKGVCVISAYRLA